MTVAIIGNGYIGTAIQEVLRHINHEFDVFTSSGRDSTMQVSEINAKPYERVFIAVPIQHHANVLEKCTDVNCPIYIEKPGLLASDDLGFHENVFVGYNRRFYNGTQALKQLASLDSTPTFHFDFSELVTRTDFSIYDDQVVDQWFQANSVHVIDTVEYVFGRIAEISITPIKSDTYNQFTGSGRTVQGHAFTFRSASELHSRWKITATTKNKHFEMCPMETLVERDVFSNERIQLAHDTDAKFKPGYLKMISEFCNGDYSNFTPLKDAHINNKRYFDWFGVFKK